MRTVQVTLDDELVVAVDGIVTRLGTTRSAFARDALRSAVDRVRTVQEEERHRKGYAGQPVGDDEFSGWEEEQAWGDA